MHQPRIAFFLCSAALLVSCRPGRPAEPGGPLLKSVDSGIKDRVSLGITVLNDNLALVRETRRVSLQEGRQILSFIGVSDDIIPESVRVIGSDREKPVFFEEQNYDTNLLTPQRIMEKSTDSKVRAYVPDPATGEEKAITGVLLSGSQGILIRTDIGVTELPSNARIEMDQAPQGLISQPSLSWIAGATSTGIFEIETSYLTGGLSWRADYVVEIDQRKNEAGIRAWATIDNTTALNLENAGLQLLAGEVGIVGKVMAETAMQAYGEDAVMAPMAVPMPKEEALFEYHLYTVERPLNVGARQKKQIALASADNVGFSAVHTIRFDLFNETIEDLPTVLVLEIEHEKDTALDVPLPAGRAAVWTEDESTGQRLEVGEADTEHTPAGEPLKIELPNDPAISAKWVPTRAQWDKDEHFIVEGALTVKNNHSSKTVLEIEIGVPGNSDFELTADGETARRKNARVWEIAVELAPEQSRTITIQTRL